MKHVDVLSRIESGAMLCGLTVNVLPFLIGALAARHLALDESTKLEGARAAGAPNL